MVFSFPRRSPPRHSKLALTQRHLEPLATLQPAVAQMRLQPRRRRGSKPDDKTLGDMRRSLRPRHVLNPIAITPHLQTVLAGESAGVQPQRPAPATARAQEETPAAAVGKADVLHRHSEDLAVGELSDGGGVRADLAQRTQPRGREERKVVDRQLHAGDELAPGRADGNCYLNLGLMLISFGVRAGRRLLPGSVSQGPGREGVSRSAIRISASIALAPPGAGAKQIEADRDRPSAPFVATVLQHDVKWSIGIV